MRGVSKMRSLATRILQFFDSLDIGRPCLSCPCGKGAMLRYIKCDDSTDGLRLHYEKCNVCGFEIYKDRVAEIPQLYERYIKGKLGDQLEDENELLMKIKAVAYEACCTGDQGAQLRCIELCDKFDQMEMKRKQVQKGDQNGDHASKT
jgi:hypothetical protein